MPATTTTIQNCTEVLANALRPQKTEVIKSKGKTKPSSFAENFKKYKIYPIIKSLAMLEQNCKRKSSKKTILKISFKV
jgi:hypothetical protein